MTQMMSINHMFAEISRIWNFSATFFNPAFCYYQDLLFAMGRNFLGTKTQHRLWEYHQWKLPYILQLKCFSSKDLFFCRIGLTLAFRKSKIYLFIFKFLFKFWWCFIFCTLEFEKSTRDMLLITDFYKYFFLLKSL